MLGCRRSNTDPLLRKMLEKHRLHLLQWPREGISPGQLVIEKQGGQTIAASLGDVFVSAVDVAKPKAVAMADIEETFSGKLEAKSAVTILDRLSSAFGGAKGSFDSAYDRATSVVLRIRQTRWHECDPARLSQFVLGAEVRSDQALFNDGDRLYVIKGVALAGAIEIVASEANGAKLELSADAVETAALKAALTARREGAANVVYSGKKPIAFGVELLELEPFGGQWRLKGVPDLVQLRGKDLVLPPEASVFLGDAEAGDVSIDLLARES